MLRTMTLNVRLMTADDGPNQWRFRKGVVGDVLMEWTPDIFGTQELFYQQGRDIVELAPGYEWFGVSRRGNQEDEHMGVFYKRAVMELLESGNFWLSETPDIPGSTSWGMDLPRMVTWGLFRLRADGQRFYFYNTHFPHRRSDAAARICCCELIRRRAALLPSDIPLILLGDFNEDTGGATHACLLEAFRDAWHAAPAHEGPEVTFHAFAGLTNTFRIDWILYRGAVCPLRTQTIDFHEGPLYPSDHYPILAELQLGGC